MARPLYKREDRVFTVANHCLLLVFMIVVLYPLIYIVSASFSETKYVYNGEMWLFPKGLTLSGYERILEYTEIWTGYANTIFYTIVGTILNLLVTLPCAYALSRRSMRGRNLIMGVFVVTMYIGGGLIPTYLNWRSFGLLNTRWLLLVCDLVVVHNVIISRTFFSTIPEGLIEAATIDGCGNFRIFLQIVLPLSSAIVAVMALYYGVMHWNGYFNAMVGLRERTMYPLQLFLREILVQSQISEQMLTENADSAEALLEQRQLANVIKYCVIVVSSAPMLMIYPFLQRYFIKGVLIGSIKG